MAGGRPTTYNPEYHNKMVFKLCLLGATDKEIADAFDIAESTLNLWKLEHPDFSESIKKGKVDADANVANSLYKRAKGFVRVTKVVKKDDNDNLIELDNEQYFPPDPTSMIYWLKNRRSKVKEEEGAQKWADKHEHVHGGNIPVRLVFESDPQNEPINDNDTGGGDTDKENTGI